MDSGTHFIRYDPDEIWMKANLTYIEQGGDILYPGDEKEMLLRGMMAIGISWMGAMDNALLMNTLTHSVDEFLDLYAERKSCYRMEAERARAVVEMDCRATGLPREIAAGTAMTADGQKIYLTEETVRLSGRAEKAAVGIIAEEAGAAGNGLPAGTRMQMYQGDADIAEIIVVEGAAGGRDREEDEAFRERIRVHGLTGVTTGPRQQYEAAARAVSPEITDARAIRTGECRVCVYLIFAEGANTDALIAETERALNPDSVRPMTDLVTAAEAPCREYALKAVCKAEPGGAEALRTAADEYHAWQDGALGRVFNPDRLIAALYQAGAQRVQLSGDSRFEDGEAVYTEIEAYERCRGTVELEITGG